MWAPKGWGVLHPCGKDPLPDSPASTHCGAGPGSGLGPEAHPQAARGAQLCAGPAPGPAF